MQWNWQHYWLHKTQDEDKKNRNTNNYNDEQHWPHQNLGVNSGTRKGQEDPASYKTPAILLI
jgi:hypothetical protein